MTLETLNQTLVFVLSLLTVFGNLLILSLILGWANGKTIKTRIVSRYYSWLGRELAENGLLFSWIIALGATIGSLYFSEIAGWVPCALCWFQRIFIFPLSIILGVAYFRKDSSIKTYAVILALMGALIAAYHHTLQTIPLLKTYSFCDPNSSCAVAYIFNFGYITMPLMTLTAFILIALSLSLGRRA